MQGINTKTGENSPVFVCLFTGLILPLVLALVLILITALILILLLIAVLILVLVLILIFIFHFISPFALWLRIVWIRARKNMHSALLFAYMYATITVENTGRYQRWVL